MTFRAAPIPPYSYGQVIFWYQGKWILGCLHMYHSWRLHIPDQYFHRFGVEQSLGQYHLGYNWCVESLHTQNPIQRVKLLCVNISLRIISQFLRSETRGTASTQAQPLRDYTSISKNALPPVWAWSNAAPNFVLLMPESDFNRWVCMHTVRADLSLCHALVHHVARWQRFDDLLSLKLIINDFK